MILHLGHYISLVQPPSVLTLSQEEMCNLMLTELTTGCVDYPDVKCGFIGEVGSGWPLHGECCHWHPHLSKMHSLFFIVFSIPFLIQQRLQISLHLNISFLFRFIYIWFMAVSDFERRAIIATGEVQAQLGCPVSFHPGRHPEAPFEIIRLFQEAGGDVKKAVMSHVDSKLFQVHVNGTQAIMIIHWHFNCNG